MRKSTRREFLQAALAASAASGLARYEALAAPHKGKVKITDVKVMMLQGPRTYTLVKVETDAGVYGVGEGYGSPGVGVKEGVFELRPEFIGKDPLEIEKLYVGLGRRTDGSAHMLLRAVSGIEMALWDLAGKILEVPSTTLLGGRYRDKVRVYDHGGPRNWLDKASCREWAREKLEHPSGFTCHKFGLTHTDPSGDPGRDLAARTLSTKELRLIRQGFENCREALGWEHDIIVHCHWEYDLRTSIQLAEAVEPIKPLFLEDPLPPDYSGSWRRLVESTSVPVAMGENLARRHGFKDFIIHHAADILHPDLRNTGGLLETKKIADLADLFYLPMANHNTGSAVCTMATVQWAAAVRDYLICETVTGRGGWMDEVVVHEGAWIKDGFLHLPDKPGLGTELNREVVEAHLAEGETWWG